MPWNLAMSVKVKKTNKNAFTFVLAISILVYPKDILGHVYRDMCTGCIHCRLVLVAKDWEGTKYQSAKDWLNYGISM